MTPTNQIVDPSWEHILERDEYIKRLKKALRGSRNEAVSYEEDLCDMRQALIRIIDKEY